MPPVFDILTMFVCLVAMCSLVWILWKIWECPNLVQPDEEQL